MSQLDLLAPTPTRREQKSRRLAWYDRIRPEIRAAHRGEVITTDDVWRLIERRPDLRIPDGMSSNIMGALFSDWSLAERTGQFLRSTREGAHGNLLRIWRIA